MTESQLRKIFTYQRPSAQQATRYERLRSEALRLGLEINSLCPESWEKEVAVQKLQESVMFANASIALNEGVQ